MPKPRRVAVLFLVLALGALAAEAEPKNGFPVGPSSPEGAACDLARAFIYDDAALFLATCTPPYGSLEARTAYHKFLEGVVVQMKLPAAGRTPSPEAPRSIVKCFAARHLTKGPANLASFGFQDVMFVDVSAQSQTGSLQVCRTLVIKTKEGKWTVDPQPELSPLQVEGLDDETPSTQEVPATTPPK